MMPNEKFTVILNAFSPFVFVSFWGRKHLDFWAIEKQKVPFLHPYQMVNFESLIKELLGQNQQTPLRQWLSWRAVFGNGFLCCEGGRGPCRGWSFWVNGLSLGWRRGDLEEWTAQLNAPATFHIDFQHHPQLRHIGSNIHSIPSVMLLLPIIVQWGTTLDCDL